MPNWVYNTLIVNGPPEEVDRFVEVAGTMTEATRKFGPPRKKAQGSGRKRKEEDNRSICSEHLCFDHFVPVPKRITGYRAGGKYASPKWLQWRLDHWGTKWEPHWPDRKRVYRTRARYGFSTAWDPPIYWLETVSGQFSELLFTLRFAWQGCRDVILFKGGKHDILVDGKLKPRKLRFAPHCWA